MAGTSHTLAWWLANDIILAAGQMGMVTDNGYYKVGDGVNKFSFLPFNTPDKITPWFSNFFPIQSKGSSLCSLYNITLIGGSLGQEGCYFDFDFLVNTAANGNTKDIYLKFANQPLFHKSAALNNVNIQLKGKIKIIDYTNKKALFKVNYLDDTGAVSLVTGNLTGIDFTQNNKLLLQGQGVADYDVVALEGEGNYQSLSSQLV